MDREREQLFRRSFSMLCRAADSPLMENKTPSFFSSSSSSLFVLLFLVADVVVVAVSRTHCSLFFSRAFFFWFLLSPYTHTLLVDIIGFVRVAIVVGCIRIFLLRLVLPTEIFEEFSKTRHYIAAHL